MTFDDVLQVVHGVSSETALRDDEARVLYNAANSLKPRDHIVEIGCEFGRSSVLLAMVAQDRNLTLEFIDPWLRHTDIAVKWMQAVHSIGHPFTLHCRLSTDVQLTHSVDPIHLLYIDGDHSHSGIQADCEDYLPLVEHGGYAAFHDYGRDSLPDIYPVVNGFMSLPKWVPIIVAGTMGLWRRA